MRPSERCFRSKGCSLASMSVRLCPILSDRTPIPGHGSPVLPELRSKTFVVPLEPLLFLYPRLIPQLVCWVHHGGRRRMFWPHLPSALPHVAAAPAGCPPCFCPQMPAAKRRSDHAPLLCLELSGVSPLSQGRSPAHPDEAPPQPGAVISLAPSPVMLHSSHMVRHDVP